MAAQPSPPNSMESSYPELAEPASRPTESTAEEELNEAEHRWFRRGSDELEEMEGLLPSVNLPDRQAQTEVWKQEAQQFETDFDQMEMKIHRFPASLQALGRRYMVPSSLSIGLYHHNSSNLQEMEMVKRVAAHHFVSQSGHTFGEMYAAVFSVIGAARGFYDAKVDVGDAEFADIMFVDGCFLLQFMLVSTDCQKLPPSLLSCFRANLACINNDIMLLENQLPWLVVDTLRRFSSVRVEEFIHQMGLRLQVRVDMDVGSPSILDGSHMPPHLLGVLWFHKTGSINSMAPVSYPAGLRPLSKSISAMELGEIGIKLRASKTAKFTDMGVKRGFFSSEIFLAPLLLDDIRSCWLVNMVAFEVSAGLASQAHDDAYQIKIVVCSYVALLAMLMDQEEDVHELRSMFLVQAELTNKETLDFFKMLAKRIIYGPLYIHIMEEVEDYKLNRWLWIKVHRFVYKNFKAIVTVFSIIGVLVGIFKTLLSIKK